MTLEGVRTIISRYFIMFRVCVCGVGEGGSRPHVPSVSKHEVCISILKLTDKLCLISAMTDNGNITGKVHAVDNNEPRHVISNNVAF